MQKIEIEAMLFKEDFPNDFQLLVFKNDCRTIAIYKGNIAIDPSELFQEQNLLFEYDLDGSVDSTFYDLQYNYNLEQILILKQSHLLNFQVRCEKVESIIEGEDEEESAHRNYFLNV